MEAVSQPGTLKSFTERRPRVMLEWDSAQNKVVAPRSQVGLSWSQTSAESTKTFSSHWQARLVDGFDIPDELLELPDLNDILSAQTWENFLTPSERQIVSMYLPEGVDPESAVEALLSGGNFHFGNPLQMWGESVCAGTMHPDAILQRELKLKEQRKAYSKRLRSYHGHMVQNLLYMKEIWEACQNPERFLHQLERSEYRRKPQKHVFHPYTKVVENAGLRKRHLYEVGEGVDQAREIFYEKRPKVKKLSKLSEEGSKRLKIKSLEFGMEKVKINSAGELADFSIRLKGGKIGQPEEGTEMRKVRAPEVGTTRLKVYSTEGVKRREINPLEEGRMKGQLNPSQDEKRRPKRKPGDEAYKRKEMIMSEEGLPGLKPNPSEEVTKIMLPGEGRKKLEMKSAGEISERLQMKPWDDEKDLATRPTTKRLNVKLSEDGAKRLGSEHAEEGTKKSQIKLCVSETGRKTQRNKSAKDESDPPSRPKTKRYMVKPPSDEDQTQRLKIMVPDGGAGLRIKPSGWGSRTLTMKSSEEGQTVQIRPARDGKGLKFQPSEEGAKIPKNPPAEEEEVPPRPKVKRSKVTPLEQGTKKFEAKHTNEGQEDLDLGLSFFEGEWFKKYVQVTVGPLSGQRLSKAIQSVKVTTKMLTDVKRRSEAGEEVHLDTLVPTKPLSNNLKAAKKSNDPSINEERIVEEVVANFWQTVLIKDLPVVHARFMQRKEQLQQLALSLASSCKNSYEIEVYRDGAIKGDISQSGDYASPIVGAPSFRRCGASLSREEASLSESEASPSVPSGEEAMKNGDEAVLRGEEAMPSEDNALLSGEEAERDEIWGINSLLLLQR